MGKLIKLGCFAFFIVEHVRAWFTEEGEILDFKEKAEIISSPSKLFELRDENLMEKYLDLVLIIYSSPKLRSTDLTMKLEGSFLYGLCYHNKGVRNRFFKLIDELIPRKIEDRIILCSLLNVGILSPAVIGFRLLLNLFSPLGLVIWRLFHLLPGPNFPMAPLILVHYLKQHWNILQYFYKCSP